MTLNRIIYVLPTIYLFLFSYFQFPISYLSIYLSFQVFFNFMEQILTHVI